MARISLVALVTACCFSFTSAAGTCGQNPYKDLLFLSNYAPAESFCSKYYPQPAITVTATGGKMRFMRDVEAKTTPKASTTTAKASSTSCDKTCSTWASCTSKGPSFVSTLCSCIEHPSTVTIRPTTTATTTTKKTKTTTTTSSAPTCTSHENVCVGGGCQCIFSPTCNQACLGTEITAPFVVSDAVACECACDNRGSACGHYNFDYATNMCYLEAQGCAISSRPGFEHGDKVEGSCDSPQCDATSTTTTTTTTTSAPAPTCTSHENVCVGGGCQCQFSPTCNQACLGSEIAAPFSASDAVACECACDNRGSACGRYSFDYSTNTCYLESSNCTISSRAGFEHGDKVEGTCDSSACEAV